ncbi:hypothetical protein GCM10010869_00830 [Mesorhizobium tianshanense]|uniref:Uncharacterized protein n=1 Tax=Mesorhizobium tianshanense TaxID=39844 RepID=A0A562NPT5_9HYPH|nr:hydrolase [Mesorhizobium tianshanense]TWI34080.1 hypothetical protein IQ26_03838 [Mesorhizobium tianshanense]GLS34495.1 hypothetical protein GCM10010869_00830 [Mesorhizobium tianshanense]
MRTNETPRYDASVNTTGCCPKFNPEGWDGQELHFKDKRFVKAATRSVMHVPMNMGSVFARVNKHIEDAGASDADRFIVLSQDISPWSSEHLFSVSKEVPGEEMAALSGNFVTKVFEGPYSQPRVWHEEMRQIARDRKSEPSDVYFFYTTCPKCAKPTERTMSSGSRR